VAGRITVAPMVGADRVVHFGLSAAWRKPAEENSTNSTGPKFTMVRFQSKPESDVTTAHLVDTGEISGAQNYRLMGLEFAAERGAASLQTERYDAQVERQSDSTLDFSGWYVQVAYTLTGEARSYKSERGVFGIIHPTRPFGKDGWGAFELAARVSDVDLSDRDVDGGEERNQTLAINWYLNSFLRLSANYVKVIEIKGGPFAGDEPSVFELRAQLAL
jgi:phosphate-selective porin OprO/OprP